MLTGKFEEKDAARTPAEKKSEIESTKSSIQGSASTPVPLPSTVAHSKPTLDTVGSISTDDDDDCDNISAISQRETAAAISSDPLSASLNSLDPRSLRLQKSINDLEMQIKEKQAKLSTTLGELRSLPSFAEHLNHHSDSEQLSDQATIRQAQVMVANHIKLLHRYNEIKDIGLGMLGLIAEKEGKRLGTVMEERGVDEKD